MKDIKNNPSNNPVAFVSLGPGDPELITLKALRLFQEADYIFYPSTMIKGRAASRAEDLLRSWDLDESTFRPFMLPMRKDRTKALAAYDGVFEEICALYNAAQSPRIVIAVEGDCSIFASIHYILDRCQEANIPTLSVPGITSFLAASSLAQLHLVKLEERLLIHPGLVDKEMILEGYQNKTNQVIMKMSQSADAIKECLQENPDLPVHYFEHVGTDRAYHTTDKEVIRQREIPYFSLLIVLCDE